MGQYFRAVNLDKQEVVCPWCIGGGAKLWEWAANAYGAVFTLLLRKSSAGGGGDYHGYRMQRVHLKEGQSLAEAIGTIVAAEGQPIRPAPDCVVGRWAGDRVVLVGDYDESKLYETSKEFRNISEELVDAWNGFIEIPERQLEFNPGCSCRKTHD